VSEEERKLDIQALKKEYEGDCSAALERFIQGKTKAINYTQDNSNLVDSYVLRLLDHFLIDFKDEVAVFMLGGNGQRQEVYPASDTDLAVVYPDEWAAGKTAEDRERLRAFEAAMEKMSPGLWDMGIEGTAVPRSIEETYNEARGDQTIRTTLEDRRELKWGSEEQAGKLDKAMNSLSRDDWLDKKLAEGQSRRAKESVAQYALNPDVKQGALRELHEMSWLAKAAGLGRGTLDDLIEGRVMTAPEKLQVEAAHAFFATVRCHLHIIHNKEVDRFGPEQQIKLAYAFPEYRCDDKTEAIEAFMRDYTKHTRMIAFWRNIVAAEAIERKNKAQDDSYSTKPVNDYDQFAFRNRQIDFATDEPKLIDMIRIFDVAQERGYKIHPFALRTMRRRSEQEHFNEALFNREDCKELLKNILTRDRNTGQTFRQMLSVGMLLRLAPPYTEIDASVDHRPGDQFTVDNHHLNALTTVNSLEDGRLQSAAPLTTNVCRSITADNEEGKSNRRVLHFALLLYKTGKSQTPVGDETQYPAKSAQNVRNLGYRFGLDEQEVEAAVWLVENQQLMLSTAYFEDLSDTSVIQDFAQSVGSQDRLDRLLILTVADVMGSGDGNWEVLQNRHIGPLYKDTAALLKDPDKPVLTPTITLTNDFNRNATNVDVVVPAGVSSALFLRIAKTLSLQNLNVTNASIEPDGRGVHRGHLVVQTAGRELCDKKDLPEIRRALERALEGDDILEQRIPVVKPKKPNGGYKYKTDVSINNKAGRTRTQVIVKLGQDEPYLLARILEVFNAHNMEVQGMKVAEFGSGADVSRKFAEATDVFFLQDPETGKPITNEKRLEAMEKDLLDILGAELRQA